MKSDSVYDAHIAELTRQRDILSAQVVEMRSLIQAIPRIITSARLDAVMGVESEYDYTKAAKACEVRVA